MATVGQLALVVDSINSSLVFTASVLRTSGNLGRPLANGALNGNVVFQESLDTGGEPEAESRVGAGHGALGRGRGVPNIQQLVFVHAV